MSSNSTTGNDRRVMRELELYIHFPFCVRKCRYCDFLSGPASEEDRKNYIRALAEEIHHVPESEIPDAYEVISVFFGGGTPSLIDPESLGLVMDALHERFFIKKNAEISMECNPGTADAERLAAFCACGINRLSIGVQSFRDSELKLLGRIHSAEEAIRCYEQAREAGFTNINLDLMSALPGQTYDEWMYSLQKAASLEPEHISAYSLIIEEGTPFASMSLPPLPDEEEDRRMYHDTKRFLESCGYHRYEISNYAREGRECIHNCGYWTGTEYLGLGLGSSSLIGQTRFHNTRDMAEYIAKAGTDPRSIREETENLSLQDQMEEFMFLGLRLTRGVSCVDFRRRFGKDIDQVYGPVIQRHIRQGLMVRDGDRLYLTSFGTDVSNSVMADYMF